MPEICNFHRFRIGHSSLPRNAALGGLDREEVHWAATSDALAEPEQGVFRAGERPDAREHLLARVFLVFPPQALDLAGCLAELRDFVPERDVLIFQNTAGGGRLPQELGPCQRPRGELVDRASVFGGLFQEARGELERRVSGEEEVVFRVLGPQGRLFCLRLRQEQLLERVARSQLQLAVLGPKPLPEALFERECLAELVAGQVVLSALRRLFFFKLSLLFVQSGL